MAQDDSLKRTGKAGGLDTESAYEEIAPNDSPFRLNLRNVGSQGQDLGYDTNINSTTALAGSLLPGINNIVGGGGFDETGQVLAFRFNSAGNCQILLYNFSTNEYQVIFTDVTDSGGQTLLPLNPANEVTAVLFNDTYAIWAANGLEAGYTNLKTLASGGYGTILWEDLSLLKPQCPSPILQVPNATTPNIITSGFGSDAGQPANYLYSKLCQFIVQGVNADYNYTAWGPRSKRFTPYQENTPFLGAEVAQNNYIIVPVYIWSTRITTLNIAVQFDDSGQFYICKSVDTSYIYALPNTSVNISQEIYEAYNPATNTYYFVFYNNTVLIPVNINETNLLFDYIYPSTAIGKLNGNLPALSNWNTLYARPVIPVTVAAVGYNPNITIPINARANPLISLGYFAGSSGSGAGNHRRNMFISLSGAPVTGDVVVIITADIRNAQAIRNYTYTVPSAQNGNLAAVVQSIAQTLSGSYVVYGTGYKISWTDLPYYGLQLFNIELYFSGATVANSIPTVLDNTSYQVAIEYFDYKLRPFPIATDDTYIVSSPSYAQQNGNATAISLTINIANAPVGAMYYQVIITPPTPLKVLDTVCCLINYLGAWNARTNSPSLSINMPTGNIGDTYQITTPFSQAAQTSSVPYTNLGTGEDYNTGDYVTNVGGTTGGAQAGTYFKVLPKEFGNIAATDGSNGILVFSLNSLALLNYSFSQENVTTNLVYDYAQGDRCTLHYWIDSSGNKNFFNQPCIDLAVLGYDAGTYLVKVENSAALTFSGFHIYYNGNQIDAKNIFMRLYSPGQQNLAASTALNTTVFREIGVYYPVTNGQHSQLGITITDGGAYYKTRQFPDAIKPYTNSPVSVLATDLNYSDFYPSAYYSFGRTRTYYDVLEQSQQSALIITGNPYIIGSKVNGLNRFYPLNIYGNNNGQISSSKGGVQGLIQRGQELIALQQRGVFYIPVNEAYTVVNDQLTGQSISSILLNNGRYDTSDVGIGLTKAFCQRYGTIYIVDPNKSLPYKITSRVESIEGKMSKFFKNLIQAAYQAGNRINLFYDDYYEEQVLTVQPESSNVQSFPFTASNWNAYNNYNITPGEVTAETNGSNSTVSYNSVTGIATWIPNVNYTGSDTATFTFNPGTGAITLNICLIWTAGNTNVNPFSFIPLTGQALSSVISSINNITVTGPNISVPISISGADGQYSVNGGAFTSAAGMVNPNDTIQVRQTSSATNSTETTTTLTIGSQSAPFNVTTLAMGSGNYNVQSQYGLTITSINNGTATGTPSALSSISISPGQQVYEVYSAITAGTIIINYSGAPVIPGSIYFGLSVSGTQVNDILVSGTGSDTLTFPSNVTNPTAISIYVFIY